MTDMDLQIVKAAIDKDKEFFNSVSQDLWKMPELAFKEFQAHAALTCALKKYGFNIEKHYFLTSAFRAVYRSEEEGGLTIAILLEYNALAGIGHACGYNLIAEAGLAAAVAVKTAMEENKDIKGKIVVLGTPAKESGGGKIRLIELGAFDNIDAAIMVHPASRSALTPSFAMIKCKVQYNGKEAHAAAVPWKGVNALDAAVACYNSMAALRQQLQPDSRLHAIIPEGGVAANVIPGKARMEIALWTRAMGGMEKLKAQVAECVKGAATVTGCSVECNFEEENALYNLINNSVILSVFRSHGERLGMAFEDVAESDYSSSYSTDMGNVSHIIPSVHPLYGIPSEYRTHTREFAEDAGNEKAQEATLVAAQALAMTCLTLLRDEALLDQAKGQFQKDIGFDNRWTTAFNSVFRFNGRDKNFASNGGVH